MTLADDLREPRTARAVSALGTAFDRHGVRITVAMGRQDMADHLGLTIETVSRMLTQLQGEAIVEFPSSRRFQVRKWTALEALAA